MELLEIKVVPMKYVSSLFKLGKNKIYQYNARIGMQKNPLLTKYMKVNSPYR
jgi:hypothetical protein